jgi:hypothetical protein
MQGFVSGGIILKDLVGNGQVRRLFPDWPN